MSKWFEEKACRIHIDSHIPNEVPELGKGFDAKRTAKMLADAGFEVAEIFSKCLFGNSYYYTQAGHQHPKLKIDMLRAMSEALTVENITVIAYYCLLYDSNQARLHPDWVIKKAKNKKAEFDHVSDCIDICLQSPYVDRIVLPQVKEIIENYPISGMFFDFARSFGYCGCVWCQEAFKKATSLELPENDINASAWREYIHWKKGEQARFEQKLVDFRRDCMNKDFTFVVNYSYTIRNPETQPRLTSYTTMDVSESAETCSLNVSFNAKYLATVPRSFEIMTSRMVNWWSGWGLKPFNTLLYQNAMIQTHGGNSILGDRWGQDWISNEHVIDYFKDMNCFVRELRKFLGKAKACAKCGILNYQQGLRDNLTTSNDTVLALAPLEAAHKILAQNHIPCLIISEEDIARYIGQLQILIVPETNIVDAKTQRILKTFVEAGGLLIGSMESGYSPEMAELWGISIKGETSRGFLKVPDRFIDDKYKFPEIPIDDKLAKFETFGADVIAESYSSVYGMDFTFGFGPIDYSERFNGVSVKSYGTGNAVYIGARIFSYYRKINNPQIKKFIGALIKEYKPEGIISSDAPDCVEFAMSESETATFLHCFNYVPEKEFTSDCNYLDKVGRISEFTVKLVVPEEVDSVEVFPADLPLPVYSQIGNNLTVTIKDLEVFQSLKFNFNRKKTI